jgi:hypothetical protein
MRTSLSKTGRGASSLGYFLVRDELDLHPHRYGTWHDPHGIYERFAVQHGDALHPQNVQTYFCLSAGLNPVVAQSAFRTSGGPDPRGFAEVIWSAAGSLGRQKILKRFAQRYEPGLAPESTSARFGNAIWAVWNDHPSSLPRDTPSRKQILTDLLWAAHQVPSHAFLLTPKASFSRQTGVDLTFDTPRDLSLLAVLSGADDRATIIDIHERAVDAGLSYLQDYGGTTRKRIEGNVWSIPCCYAAVRYVHFLPRPVVMDSSPTVVSPLVAGSNSGVDPHMHTHVHVVNLVRDCEGDYRSLDQAIVADMQAGIMLAYRNELAFLVRSTLGLPVERIANDSFRICEIDRKVVESYSLRKNEIHGAIQKRFAATSSAVSNAEFARRITRSPKLAVHHSLLYRHWQERGHAIGFGEQEARQLLQSGRGRKVDTTEPDASFVLGVAQSMPVKVLGFDDEALRTSALRQSMGTHATPSVLRACATARRNLVNIGLIGLRHHYVTPAMAIREMRLLADARTKYPVDPVLMKKLADAIDKTGKRWENDPDRKPDFDTVPRLAVEALLLGDRHLRILDGPHQRFDQTLINDIQKPYQQATYTFVKEVLNDVGFEVVELNGDLPAGRIWTKTQVQSATTRVKKCIRPVAVMVRYAEHLKFEELETLVNSTNKGHHMLLLMADMHSLDGVRYASMLRLIIADNPRNSYYAGPRRHIQQAQDDSILIEKVRLGQSPGALVEMLRRKLLRLARDKKSSYASLVEKVILDHAQYPDENLAVLAANQKTLDAVNDAFLRQQKSQKQQIFLPKMILVEAAAGQTFDRAYVVQDGLDLVAQYIAVTRHRICTLHYVDRETQKQELRKYVKYAEFEKYAGLDIDTDLVMESLVHQWRTRKLKLSVADSADEWDNLKKLLSSLHRTTRSPDNPFDYEMHARHQPARNKEILAEANTVASIQESLDMQPLPAVDLTDTDNDLLKRIGDLVKPEPFRLAPLARRQHSDIVVTGVERDLFRQRARRLQACIATHKSTDETLCSLLDSVDLEDLHLPWARTQLPTLEKIDDRRRYDRDTLATAIKAGKGSSAARSTGARVVRILENGVCKVPAGNVDLGTHDGGPDVGGPRGP